jgi:hypothetical protein
VFFQQGFFYPLEIFLVVGEVEKLGAALYKYNLEGRFNIRIVDCSFGTKLVM